MLTRLSINMFQHIFLKPNQILLWQLRAASWSSGLCVTENGQLSSPIQQQPFLT